MSYLDNFNVERIDSIPEVKQQLRNLRRAIDNKEIGTYTPPSTGIPPTDLSQEVRNSLLKADNAVPTAISTTWSELKALRDNSQLIPGCWYRITDYECTTSQAHTKSARHKFDILVLATSVNILSEEARAIQSERDNELRSIYSDTRGVNFIRCSEADGNFESNHYYAFYNGSGNFIYVKSLTDVPTANNTYYFYDDNDNEFIEIRFADDYDTLSGIGETVDSYIFGYFTNSNLNAWKIWYCLDNDTSRFAWAADYQLPESVGRLIRLNLVDDTSYICIRYPQGDLPGKYCFKGCSASSDITMSQFIEDGDYSTEDEYIYSSTEYPNIGDYVDQNDDNVEIIETSDKGIGVIYRMIDENNNDCPYDFKNIMFRRYSLSNTRSYCKANVELDGFYGGYYSQEDDDYVKPGGFDLGDIVRYFYTFASTIKKINALEDLDASLSSNVKNNKIYNFYTDNKYVLASNIIAIKDSNSAKYNKIMYNCVGITIINSYSVVVDVFCTNIASLIANYCTIKNNCQDIVLANSSNVHIGSLCYSIPINYTNRLSIASNSFDMAFNGVNNKQNSDIAFINSANALDVTTLVTNVTFTGGYYDGESVGNTQNKWIGVDSNDNIRYWNPADPSGT